eukprot:GFUD01042174.1.p1 GENE.GFUD01042174.1~~GFUD01042174.1.p1  ORF type:complete len:752 (-),score=236.91 GFUD01042174.1:30-2204(-)
MLDLPEHILGHLETADVVTSSDLAQKFGCDSQKIVGAVKSLEALGGYIETEVVAVKKWILTKEGGEVKENGSHEGSVFGNVPEGGINQKELMIKCGSLGKVGFSKAMSNGWIFIDKSDGGLVKRKLERIEDLVQKNLGLLQQGKEDLVDEKLKSDYKKRKLVEEVTEKIYNIKKGDNFSTTITKIPTEITPEMIQSGSWKKTTFKPYNLDALGVEPSAGHLHPLLKVRAEYRQIFLEMGFTEMPTNNYLESSFWNFDALFQPQQHPARDAHDTFFISDPATTKHFPQKYLEKVKKIHSSGGFGSQGYGYDWKVEEASKNLLRTHTTAVSARMLYKLANQEGGFTPQKYFSIDRVFRNETLDATHLAEFHQIEGVIADRGLTLGDLIGVLYQFFMKLGIEKLRFKPAYNPYTEPSMEIFSYHEGLGKWVEIGNSGVFRPEMLLPMGLPEDVNVIAWGLSLERPTMIKYGVDNIRDLVGHKVNLGMVQTNPLCRLDKPNTNTDRQVDVVSKRWDKITARLEILQQRVSAAAGGLTLSTEVRPVSNLPTGLVVHCPVTQPPYSLTLLTPLLSKHTPVFTSTHTHSSVDQKCPTIFPPTALNRSQCPLKLTLIFSSVDQTKLVLSSTKSILGEANLLRYLARIFPNTLYESSELVNKIDSVLDSLACTDGKHSNTKLVTAALEKNKFLAGEQLSLADLLGLSVVKVHNIVTPQVKEWQARCSKEGFNL